MGGIFGLVSRDGAPVAAPRLEILKAGMPGRGHSELWSSGCIVLGQTVSSAVPEAQRAFPPPAAERVICVAAGRVDNLEELSAQLSIDVSRSGVADASLIHNAYLKWGEDCVRHIYGDWSFAAWHPAERRLFVARDHYGITALYYYADDRVFAFASDRKLLLALNLAPMEMNELYLAQVLIAWPARHGSHTIYKSINRLRPGHSITITADRLYEHRYWRIEDTPALRLPHRRDYALAFREVFDEAVRARLRPIGGGPGDIDTVAATLSGGLDSSSVTATAAGLLQQAGKRLSAFTSVPISDFSSYAPNASFGDEFPFARQTADLAGNVDHFPVAAAEVSPLQAIRKMLEIHDEPMFGAANVFWILDLHQTLAMQGYRVLLSGSHGNAGISYPGDVFSQPLAVQLRMEGYRRWTKEKLRRALPTEWIKAWRLYRTPPDWYCRYAINPDFARRINLLERRLDGMALLRRTFLEQRCFDYSIASVSSGAVEAQEGAAFGLEMRDPTGDARVMAFTFSVPDHIYIDPKTGLNRWLIREAMRDRLPDAVRLNRNRGLQAADLVPRLRACADEVNAALDELAPGPAAEYVNVPNMREVWRVAQTEDTPRALVRSASILLRGIMAGLWVNDFYDAA